MPEKHMNKLSEDMILESILYSSTDMAIAATDLDFRILYYNPVDVLSKPYNPEELSQTLHKVLKGSGE
jgi:hypothetical protein